MADPGANASSAGGASSKPPRPPNPIWKMMGLPNFRLKLPSRNWMIFLSVVGTWTAAVTYDRREKRRIQRKWAQAVEHIAQEPLDTHQLPRRLTIYLSAPPADGLLPAREHFNEYIKPILVAAALDWDAIEGRKEGDVRAGLAEKIRKLRKTSGEPSTEPIEEEMELVLDEARKRAGVRDWDGPGGDIVVGRHTWKEYVRGLHEGWLGPLDTPAPKEEAPSPSTESSNELPPSDSNTSIGPSTDDASPTAAAEAPKTENPEKPQEEENKPKKKKQPPPFNTCAEYENAIVSPSCPRALGPSAIVAFPHLLGFLNFPIRIYRYLNRRHVADEIGRQTTAAVLGAYRPFDAPGESAHIGDEDFAGPKWEQQSLLEHEEPEWHKSVRERKEDHEKERVWLDDMVLDPRIAERMRRFVLEPEAEERANRLASESENNKVPWLSRLWPKSEKKQELWEGLSDD